MPNRLVTVAATGVAVARAAFAGTVSAPATRSFLVLSATNARPIVVGATGHGLQPGFLVTISGVGGNLAANGTFLVRSVTVNDFTIENLDHSDTVGSGAYTSSGTITSTDVLIGSGFSVAQVGYRMEILAGQGQGQVRLVAAVPDAFTLVPNRAWTIAPDTTSGYRVSRGTAGILFLKSAIFSVGAGAGAVTLRDGAAGANLLTLSCPASDSRVWSSGGDAHGLPFASSIYVQALSGTTPSITLEYGVGT